MSGLSAADGAPIGFGVAYGDGGDVDVFRCDRGETTWTAGVEQPGSLRAPTVGPLGHVYLHGEALWGLQPDGDALWKYDFPEDTFYAHISPSDDGVYVLVMPSKARHRLVKLTHSGTEQWSVSLPRFGRGNSSAEVRTVPGGGVLVQSGQGTFWFDSDGTLSRKYSAPLPVLTFGPDGSLYTKTARGGSIKIRKLDPGGDAQWEKEFSGEHVRTVDPFLQRTWHGEVGGLEAVATPETFYLIGSYGNYLRTGKSVGPRQEGLAVLALDADDGTFKWGRQYKLAAAWPADKGVKFGILNLLLLGDDELLVRGQESRGYPVRGTFGKGDIEYRNVIFRVALDR